VLRKEVQKGTSFLLDIISMIDIIGVSIMDIGGAKMARPSPYDTGELTDSIFFILLSMLDPIHGYLVMQKVEELTDSMIEIGPATMYTTTAKLLSAGWIEEHENDGIRKEYQVTDTGKEILKQNFAKRKFLLSQAEKVMKKELDKDEI